MSHCRFIIWAPPSLRKKKVTFTICVKYRQSLSHHRPGPQEVGWLLVSLLLGLASRFPQPDAVEHWIIWVSSCRNSTGLPFLWQRLLIQEAHWILSYSLDRSSALLTIIFYETQMMPMRETVSKRRWFSLLPSPTFTMQKASQDPISQRAKFYLLRGLTRRTP